MPSADELLVEQLFCLPGDPASSPDQILALASDSSRQLSISAGRSAANETNCLLEIVQLAKEPACCSVADRFFRDPVFLQALHQASNTYPLIRDWRRSVASPSMADVADQSGLPCADLLTNAWLTLRLRVDTSLCGEFELSTDIFGRLRFPLSPWTIDLSRRDVSSQEVLARHPVTLVLDDGSARWFCGDHHEPPFLEMSRAACINLVLDSVDGVPSSCHVPDRSGILPIVHKARRLGDTRIRLEIPRAASLNGHDQMMNRIALEILNTIQRISPTIFTEFDELMDTILGFELTATDAQSIGSFSDPLLPGFMGFNIPFDDRHEAMLSPFCFTWFGHEMAHTKMYLINMAAFARGWTFVSNPERMTRPIARYGRSLPVRTLIQLPYVHLYEWMLLMDAIEAGLDTLPWHVGENPRDAGAELREEIAESFEWINEFADLTQLGHSLLAHTKSHVEAAESRWTTIGSSAVSQRVSAAPARRSNSPRMIFRLGAIFIALSMFATTASSSESGFRVIDNSVGISQVIALNSAGEVVGSKEISESGSLILRTAPYFHDGISEKQIPNLGRYTNMQPQSVSDDGRVVGFAGRAPSDSHGGFQAFLWNSESAELEGLGFLPGHISSCALDVSADTRTVVGFSLGRQPSSMVPCYWERKNGAWNCHSLSTPRRDNSYLQTSRVVISDDGSRIAACVLASNTNGTDGNRPGGDSYYSNHLFMWLRDVTGHFSGKSIEARGFRLAGINNHGVIAATRTIRDRERAFVWEPNRGLRQIDLLPGDVRAHALGLNNRGIVVGYSDDPYGPDGGPRAFIWRRGVVRPLPLPQRALFSVATCITDNGLVGGYLEYEQSSDRSSKTVSFVLNLDLDESSGFFSAIE